MKWLILTLSLATTVAHADIAAPPPAGDESSVDELGRAIDRDGHITLYRLYFETGKPVLKKESEPLLERIRDLLARRPTLRLRIEGHTDPRGAAEWNLRLSQARADAVKAWLVAHAIDAARLEAVGFGETKPIADNRTEEGRSRNRRVELVRLP